MGRLCKLKWNVNNLISRTYCALGTTNRHLYKISSYKKEHHPTSQDFQNGTNTRSYTDEETSIGRRAGFGLMIHNE